MIKKIQRNSHINLIFGPNLVVINKTYAYCFLTCCLVQVTKQRPSQSLEGTAFVLSPRQGNIPRLDNFSLVVRCLWLGQTQHSALAQGETWTLLTLLCFFHFFLIWWQMITGKIYSGTVLKSPEWEFSFLSSLSSLRSFCLKFGHLVSCTASRRNQSYFALHDDVPLVRNRCFLHNLNTEKMEKKFKAWLLL